MFPKKSGYMHMDKWNTQFILVMLCSMRDTEISRVEGLWLCSRPKHSVSEDSDGSPKVPVCSPFIVPSQNSTRDHCDIISWCHNCLLWSSSGKTTVHVHRKHCISSAHPLASMQESLITINASEPLCLFLNLNSMPVTLSPRYFSAPSYQSLNLFTHFQQSTDRYNKQTRVMDATYWLKYLKKNKTWQVNTHLIGNLRYLHAKHTIHNGRKDKPATCTNMTNHHGASSPFTSK